MLKTLLLILSCSFFVIVSAYAEESIHDPTQPFGVVATAPEPQGNIRIDAILTGKKRNIAIIAGKRFTVGDKIGETKITAILPNEVHVRDDSGEYVIKFTTTLVKKPSTKQP